MSKYLLTIRVPIYARDDLEARQEAQDILYDIDVETNVDYEPKLQLLIPNREPKKIVLN